MMHRIITRRTVVDTERIAPKPAYLPLNQQLRRLRREPRKMHLPFRILIPVLLRIRPPRRPSRPQQHNRAFGNPPVPLLPFFDARGAKLILRILATLGPDAEDIHRAKYSSFCAIRPASSA